jgi:hypothetical protein
MPETMKLMDVPKGSWVMVVDDTRQVPVDAPEVSDSEILRVGHLDGMYVNCYGFNDKHTYLAAWTRVMIVDEPN